MKPERRVLSIQSHVVSGYVGNKAATFPLQVLGYDVDCINSVQFSNHTGFPTWKGERLDGDQLLDLYQGLKQNNLLDYSHVLTGYIGSASFLRSVITIVIELKKKNSGLIYVCDPVMGDDSKLYVPEDLVPIFRDELCPLADVLTPNHFEAELLTGMKIRTEAECMQALELLHNKGASVVVLTSCTLAEFEDRISVYGSSRVNGKSRRFRCAIKRLPGAFTGTGDLFSALLLAWTDLTGGDAAEASRQVLGTMQAVLKRTHEHAAQCLGKHSDNTCAAETAKARELQLIKSKCDIEAPPPLPESCDFTIL